MKTQAIPIQKLERHHFEPLFKIFVEISASGICWPYSYELSQEKFEGIWYRPGNIGYVATIDGQVAGAYFIREQWPDRGAHIATAQYMVSSDFRGNGLGFLLGEHSIKTAREAQFSALQLNLVVSTNKPAVNLYLKLGFKIAGTIPSGFDHPQLGRVDTFLMHRFL
jgi:ribosomal protein S18 acetylase RimI-like enzyme